MRLRRTLVAAVAALVALVLVAPAAPVGAAGSDPLFAQQYGPQQVNAPTAWAASTGRGVVIAIVDTGVDLGHPDLAGKLVAGVDMVDDDTTPQDEHGHGTHVAGIAAAITGNGVGIAGVAPEARIMPVRVLDKNGTGDATTVADGVRWAVDHGARVINLSLSGQVTLLDALFGNPLEESISYAWSKGAVVVAAAGNLDAAGSSAPSGYSKTVKAIVVTATDRNKQHPAWANRADTDWSVAAPGDAIVSTEPGGKYGLMSGTSMSAPHVSAIAALLLAQGLTNRQVVDRVLTTAHPLGARSSDGAGLVDAAAAVGAPVKAAGTPTSSAASPPATSRSAGTSKSTAPRSSSTAAPVALPPSSAAPSPTAPVPTYGGLGTYTTLPDLPPAPAPQLVPPPSQLAASASRHGSGPRGVPLGVATLLLAVVLFAFLRSWRRTAWSG